MVKISSFFNIKKDEGAINMLYNLFACVLKMHFKFHF